MPVLSTGAKKQQQKKKKRVILIRKYGESKGKPTEPPNTVRPESNPQGAKWYGGGLFFHFIR